MYIESVSSLLEFSGCLPESRMLWKSVMVEQVVKGGLMQ